MIHGHVNYFAVLTAAIVSVVIGFVWYSRPVFGTLWWRIIGYDKLTKAEIEKMQKEIAPYFAVIFIASFIGAAVLARFIAWLGMATLGGGLRVAFWAWLGFVFPLTLGNALFGGKDKSLIWPMFLVQAVHELFVLLAAGAILGAWL